MSRYETLLFDADDTLFDFQKSQQRALEQLFSHYDIPNTETNSNLYKEINHQLWEAFELGAISKDMIQQMRFTKLFEALQRNEDGVSANDIYLDFLTNGADLIEGAYTLCETLSKQYKLYIVTNGISEVQHKRFDQSAIKPFITNIFVSEDSGFQKPQKEYFEYVFARIGTVDIEKTIIIGDSLTSDIKGGNHIGIATCWYNPNRLENKTDAICDYEIQNLEELFHIVS